MDRSVADAHSKVRSHHLERAAYVYIRQSSVFQVENHLESKRRQYNLVEWVVQAGWPREKVVVVDEDQGKSGAYAYMRSGFGNMVTAVGRREVGIIASLEFSRLARNSPDWSHLVYICRWTSTLIADEEGVYDPTLSADRFMLGIRGQVSEAEYETSSHRMVAARWSKAARGEVMTILPAGYDIDDLGQAVMTSDESIAHAIRTVFAKFDELGSGRQVLLWWRAQGLKFPVRRTELRTHPVVWLEPKYSMVHSTLRNPVYAGVYAFGKSQTVRQLDVGDSRQLVVRRVVRKEWPVLIKDHHMAYISYEKYLKNQELLRGNLAMRRREDDRESGPVREGKGLLQGLVRCHHCGRRMSVEYSGGRPTRPTGTQQYRCHYGGNKTGTTDCQVIGGARIDAVVVQAFLEATGPAAIEALRVVAEQVRRQSEAVDNYWKLQIEKTEYDTRRAERQFNAVEPENRPVARELERRWNARLCELDALRVQARQAQETQAPLTEGEIERARLLGGDVATVWSLDTTTDRDRKRLLRCLIEEVQLDTNAQRTMVRIIWKGGAVTDREVLRRTRTTRPGATATPEETIELVRQLAKELEDLQIARILNTQGRRSGFGRPFTRESVLSIRRHYEIPACPAKPSTDPHAGPFTADEAARELGVTSSTIHRWLREGVLAGRQATAGAPWQIPLTDTIRRRLSGGDAPAGWVGLSEAARRLGLSKALVAYMVKRGKLKAERATVGKRQCWRIEVPSTSSGQEDSLFDPMTNDLAKEA
jgi:DNA invertase Pin-like site-specific DNA recombinase